MQIRKLNIVGKVLPSCGDGGAS